ncbi:MAG: chromate transporter [Firmicutes bacterium]|nr:chromate transporter [Bacillota bacterium]
MIYIELFLRFCLVSLCSIGGGYSAIPIIQSQIVNNTDWISATQFADIVTISEMTPGPVFLNAATFTGQQIAGLPGAVAATLGSVTPSIIIVTAVSVWYFKHKNSSIIQDTMSAVRPAIGALILTAGISLLMTAVVSESWVSRIAGLPVDIWACVWAVVCFCLLRFLKKSPITIIGLSALAGLIVYGIAPQMFVD